MSTVLLILFLFVSLVMIGLILIQRSEGGGLGIGGGQSMGGLMTGRGTANLLTRMTSILGALFFALALVLALLGRGGANRSLLDALPPGPAENRPVGTEAPPAPATSPAALPDKPAVPTN